MGDALAKKERKWAQDFTPVDLFALTRDAGTRLSDLVRKGGATFAADLQELRDQLADINDRVKALEVAKSPTELPWMSLEINKLHEKLRFAAIRDERVERAVHILEAATGCKILTDSQGNVRVIGANGNKMLLPTGYTAHMRDDRLLDKGE